MTQPIPKLTKLPRKGKVPKLKLPRKGFWSRAKSRLKAIPRGAKVGTVAAAGALVVFGAPAILPVGVGGVVLAGYYALKNRKDKYSSCMTPELVEAYERALSSKDPDQLRTLADRLEKAGCRKEADHLRKRAALRDRSPEEKSADQARYKRAMADTVISKIEKEAEYFKSIGADGSAANLLTRAAALRTVKR